MNAAVLAVASLVLFVLAFRIYARWIERRVYDTDNDQPTPAHTARVPIFVSGIIR